MYQLSQRLQWIRSPSRLWCWHIGYWKEVLQHLNEQANCLPPFSVTPKVVNGTKLYPLGKIPVHLQLGCHEYDDELNIYPNISGALLSWKACKGLGILPDHYHVSIICQRVNQLINLNHNNTTPTSSPFTFDNILKEFPIVFEGQIRTMTGEVLVQCSSNPRC